MQVAAWTQNSQAERKKYLSVIYPTAKWILEALKITYIESFVSLFLLKQICYVPMIINPSTFSLLGKIHTLFYYDVFHVLSSVTLNWEFLSLFEGFPRNIYFWHWIPLASLCRGGKKFRGPKVAPEITFGRGTASTVQRSHAKINCTLTI